MNFPMEAIYAGLAIAMGLVIALMAFDKLSPRRRLLFGALIAATTFGLMLLMHRELGVAAGWNVFALLFIGAAAWQSQKVYEKAFFREPQPWDGHRRLPPETEEFSDGLLLTTNVETGNLHGVVLSGPFRHRELHQLSGGELDDLASDLAARDERGHALLTKYRTHTPNAAS